MCIRDRGKGMVWVNGHAMGRFWEIGPQQTLYMPGCWLKKGKNEIIVLDLKGTLQRVVRGLKKPILDVLRKEQIDIHRRAGQTLDLSIETPVPVSYTHLDVYKRQVLAFPKTVYC